MARTSDPFAGVRAVALALPRVTERVSHGMASFFLTPPGRQLVSCCDHHGDGIVGLWLAAPPGEQEARLAEDPEAAAR